MFSRVVVFYLLCGVMLCGGVVTVNAQDSFNVDSYIPVKFTDRQLRVDGRFNMEGTNNDESDRSVFISPPTVEPYISTRSGQVLDLGSNYKYTYWTLSKFVDFQSSIGTNFQHLHADREYSRSQLYDSSYDAAQRDESRHVYSFSTNNTFDGGKYLASDLFVAATLVFNAGYDAEPGSKFKQDRNESMLYPDGRINLYNSHSDDEVYSNARDYRISFQITPGWGRMYPGQYAATALYVVNELDRAGILIAQPTFEQMQELTELIYQRRNELIIDSRIHRLESLESIYTYLSDNGLVETGQCYGAFVFQDVWDYFPRDDRNFGFMIRAGGGLMYTYSSSHISIDEYDVSTSQYVIPGDTTYTNVNENTRTTYIYSRGEQRTPFTIVTLEYSKPLDFRWQLDIAAGATVNLSPSRTQLQDNIRYENGTLRTYSEDRYESEADYTIDADIDVTYILNSRTRGRLLSSFTYDHENQRNQRMQYDQAGYLSNETTELAETNVRYTYFAMRPTLEYRLSIPTTLIVSVNYNYSKREQEYIDHTSNSAVWSYSATIQLNHYLF